MTIKGLFVRFGLIYFVAMIAAGFGLQLLDIKGGSGINIGILMGTAYWACATFCTENRRYFTSREKLFVVAGLIAIDLLIQLVLGSAVMASKVAASQGDLLGALVVGLLIVGLLHAIAIVVVTGLVKKPLVKQGIISG